MRNRRRARNKKSAIALNRTVQNLMQRVEGEQYICPTCGADEATCAAECKTAPCCCELSREGTDND